MTPLLVHNVFFALNDASQAAKTRLLDACRKYLTGHPGTVFFACGTLAKDLARPVNDRDFDVGLHIIFESQAAHDAYQVAPRHEPRQHELQLRAPGTFRPEFPHQLLETGLGVRKPGNVLEQGRVVH